MLSVVPMPSNTSDPLPYVSKLDRSADAVFAALLGPDLPRALTAIRQLGFANKAILTADCCFGLADILALKKTAEGVWGMDSSTLGSRRQRYTTCTQLSICARYR